VRVGIRNLSSAILDTPKFSHFQLTGHCFDILLLLASVNIVGVRSLATSLNYAGSIPDEMNEFFEFT
jgi:hypothetical protein